MAVPALQALLAQLLSGDRALPGPVPQSPAGFDWLSALFRSTADLPVEAVGALPANPNPTSPLANVASNPAFRGALPALGMLAGGPLTSFLGLLGSNNMDPFEAIFAVQDAGSAAGRAASRVAQVPSAVQAEYNRRDRARRGLPPLAADASRPQEAGLDPETGEKALQPPEAAFQVPVEEPSPPLAAEPPTPPDAGPEPAAIAAAAAEAAQAAPSGRTPAGSYPQAQDNYWERANLFANLLDPQGTLENNLRLQGMNPTGGNPALTAMRANAQAAVLPTLAAIFTNPDAFQTPEDIARAFMENAQNTRAYAPGQAQQVVQQMIEQAYQAPQMPDSLAGALMAALRDEGMQQALFRTAATSGLAGTRMGNVIGRATQQAMEAAPFLAFMQRSAGQSPFADSGRPLTDYEILLRGRP